MKGGALNLGLTSVSKAALALEMAIAADRDTAALENLINSLSDAYKATLKALQMPVA
jgi:HPt (histidine-containing phosphotransfer) domain-containing protein